MGKGFIINKLIVTMAIENFKLIQASLKIIVLGQKNSKMDSFPDFGQKGYYMWMIRFKLEDYYYYYFDEEAHLPKKVCCSYD